MGGCFSFWWKRLKKRKEKKQRATTSALLAPGAIGPYGCCLPVPSVVTTWSPGGHGMGTDNCSWHLNTAMLPHGAKAKGSHLGGSGDIGGFLALVGGFLALVGGFREEDSGATWWPLGFFPVPFPWCAASPGDLGMSLSPMLSLSPSSSPLSWCHWGMGMCPVNGAWRWPWDVGMGTWSPDMMAVPVGLPEAAGEMSHTKQHAPPMAFLRTWDFCSLQNTAGSALLPTHTNCPQRRQRCHQGSSPGSLQAPALPSGGGSGMASPGQWDGFAWMVALEPASPRWWHQDGLAGVVTLGWHQDLLHGTGMASPRWC